MKRIYVETSFISYLTARPSSNITLLARQQAAHAVWALKGQRYEAYISELVIDEITRGDLRAAQRRVEACEAATVLPITAEADLLAKELISKRVIPATEPEDALHVAVATLRNMDYILSFNFSHMVGVEAKFVLQTAIAQLGYKPPLLVTADDLLEELWNDPQSN
jgi:predicted nucleic acid-binding protein